jgi:hypothetical protein
MIDNIVLTDEEDEEVVEADMLFCVLHPQSR